MKTLSELIDTLPEAEKLAVEARAQELISEELASPDLGEITPASIGE